MMAQIKQMQAKVDIELEDERAKLKMLQAQMDVNAAAARVRVYSQMEGNIDAEYDSFCGQNGASYNCK